jgi:hypothetical protein
MSGRIRTIKPETLEDERPAALSDSAWRLWVSMWLVVDDHGNCRASASWLAGQVWWAHDQPPDVEALLAELEAAGSIRRYVVRGQTYAHVERWERHQRIDNAGKSRVPAPDDEGASALSSEPAAASRAATAARKGSRKVSASLRESPRTSEICRSDLDLDPDPEGDGEREVSVAASPPAAPPLEPAKEQLPFTLRTALQALKETAGMAITLAPFDNGLAKPLTRLVRMFPELADWRLAGEWLAAGGEGWLVDGPDLRWLAKSGNLASAIGKARKWAEAGKGPMDGRRGRAAKVPTPPCDPIPIGQGGSTKL